VLVNLLVVQEEPPVASFIKRGLEAEGFVVRTACDGAEGLEMSRSADLDLIVLDLVLPTVTGEEILARLRAAGSSVPVIVLTSSDAVPDQVAILNAGADDYVTRPCSFSELLARIRARLRAADQTVSTTISHGRVTIDVATRDVRIGGSSVDLTPREFALLETLMRHAGQVLSNPSSSIRSGDTTAIRAPTWWRSTSAISARSSDATSWRPSAAPGIGSAADIRIRFVPSFSRPDPRRSS
jgi:two-component system copper resistance phosphate regulon response regulator CusR